MKIKEIKELTDKELVQKEKELRESLYNLKTQQQLGGLEKTHLIKEARRGVSKVKTVLKEKELQKEGEK
jgi:large subunit ribosomal protein L29